MSPRLAGSLQLPAAEAYDTTDEPANAGDQLSETLFFLDPRMDPTGIPYTWPDLKLRPRSPIEIQRIYLPITAQALNASDASPVTQADFLVSLTVRGELRWTSAGTLDMPSGAASGPVGNSAIADDLINPIVLQLDDVGELSFRISFNAAISSWWFYVGAQIQSPLSSVAVATPGSAFYTSLD